MRKKEFTPFTVPYNLPQAVDREAAPDLSRLYDNAHEELSLQQSKRDQIIMIYLALVSFLIPFTMSQEGIDEIRWLLFLLLGVVGVMFSLVVIRYRIYKEVYWLTCETLSCLMRLQKAELNKSAVQAVFLRTLKKRGKGFLKDGKWSARRYVAKSFGAEFWLYSIIALMTSVMFAFAIALLFDFTRVDLWLLVPAGVFVLVFLLLHVLYLSHCSKVYDYLKTPSEGSFNTAFSKAWFLHFYLD